MSPQNMRFAHSISKWIATFGGIGFSPWIPGTAGSLAAMPFAWLIHSQFGASTLLLASCIAFLIGWWATQLYLKTTSTSADPSEVVIDEVAGQWLILSYLGPDAILYCVGFLLFRFFDIFKPWPISWADKHIKGGLGVMLDDIVASAYGILLIYLYRLYV